MKATDLLAAALLAAGVPVCSGCLVAPRTQLTACQAQNRILAEQSRAQLAEIENLRVHSRNIEDQLMRTEEELALLEEGIGLDRNQLASHQRQRAELQERFKGLANAGASVSPQLAERLQALSQRHAGLNFDPVTGISKLDVDVLFDSGSTEVKPEARQVLQDLVDVLKSPEAAELKVMVVGHTDDRRIAKRPARDRYPNNFHLSAARALAVADAMQRQGLPQQRLGVAGFGAHQPIAPNVTPKDRQKNRRVEIFVMNQDVPVVGWTESIPSLY